MKKMIINADDFGYSAAVNYGIIHAFREGILTSATLMANMPGTKLAIQLAKENPTLGIGAHLVLTIGKPLSQCDTCVDDEGSFYTLSSYREHRPKFKDEEIYKEWCAQIDCLLDQGVHLTHLDSHHHVHSFLENQEIIRKLSETYALPFRNCNGVEVASQNPEYTKNQICIDLMNTTAIRSTGQAYMLEAASCYAELVDTLDKVKTYEVVEAMVHPAFVDEELYFRSSFNIQRMREVDILVDDAVKKIIEDFNFSFVNYGDFSK